MTPPNAVGTLIMPEETGIDETFDCDQDAGGLPSLVSVSTHLTRVEDLILQHTLDVFDEAWAPSVQVLRSVMTRALSQARERLAVTNLSWHDDLLAWGNAVLRPDGTCAYLAGVLSDVDSAHPMVFPDTWTQAFDPEPEDTGEDDVTDQDDAVGVVEALAAKLGLPVRDVLKAAGIKRSSFYSWKKPGAPRPRVASQGRLWTLAQTVEDVDETTGGNVRKWLLARDARRLQLVHGEFDRLLAEATAERSTPGIRAEPTWAATFGAGAEHDTSAGPPPPSDRHPPPFKRATPAQVPTRPDRRKG